MIAAFNDQSSLNTTSNSTKLFYVRNIHPASREAARRQRSNLTMPSQFESVEFTRGKYILNFNLLLITVEKTYA